MRNREVGTKHVFAGGTRLVSKLVKAPNVVDLDGDGIPDDLPNGCSEPWGWTNGNGNPNGNGQGPCNNNGNGGQNGNGGNNSIRCYECKSSQTAPLTPNQTSAFPQIEETGGVIVGRGKPGFEGGTELPPTRIEILRPPVE